MRNLARLMDDLDALTGKIKVIKDEVSEHINTAITGCADQSEIDALQDAENKLDTALDELSDAWDNLNEI